MAGAIEICNLALSRLGADLIRSFDEPNKRARLCEITYKHVRDLFLEDHEWTFNTKFAALPLLANVTHPSFSYVYQLPYDCLYPRQLVDELGVISSKVKWSVFEDHLATNVENAWLRYSFVVEESSKFPMYFVEAVAAQMAAEMCPAIVQDKKRYSELLPIAELQLARAREKDSEIGVEYRQRDVDFNNDTWIMPEGGSDGTTV